MNLRLGAGIAAKTAATACPAARLAAALVVAAAARASAAPAPPTLAGHADAATYRFYINEEVLVTSEYEWKDGGAYHGRYTLSTAGQTVTTSLAIQVDAAGQWQRMTMETPRGPVTVAREDSLARIEHAGDTRTVTLRPGTLLFENFSPALMTLAIRAYDSARGGKQTFPIFIVPSVVMDASLERLDTIERPFHGRDLRLTRYTYGLPGVDVILHVAADGTIVFADVPSQHGAYVRDGYEALMQAAAPGDSLLSRPQHEVDVDRGVRIPMRDGVELSADIYRPRAAGRFPVILVRTPYKKEMNELQASFFARRGYVYAVQDCRGRFGSGGEWEPFVHEAHDGYDSIEWLAAQPWSSGRVGMIGASYLGWVQWWAARDRPPHLVTIVPNVAPPDPHDNIPYEHGAFFLLGAIWWADVLESEATGDLTGQAMQAIAKKKYSRLLRHLPVVELDEKVLGKRNPYWRRWIEHPDNDAYWEPANFRDRLAAVNIPVFHQSGWFDGDGIGSKLNYLAMAAHGHAHQKLVLGPWGHTDTATRRIGDRDFGPEAILDLQRLYLRWLDRWLKGLDNGIEREPLVSLFVMGTNRWLHGSTYPLPGTRMTPFYLTSGGGANTSAGDGRLTLGRPGRDVPADRYTYDPADPTPSPHFYVSDDEDSTRVVAVEDEIRKRRAYYAAVAAERRDILVYETPALEAPLTFAGPIEATLYASTTARDTDWFVRLAEVAADGQVFALTEGKVRARYRESTRRPQLLEPGRVYEYRLDLWQTGITIPAGAKLRVEVASASFPVFSRNLNTGGHNEMETEHVRAEQTIHHDARRPSHVLLPVIPEAMLTAAPEGGR